MFLGSNSRCTGHDWRTDMVDKWCVGSKLERGVRTWERAGYSFLNATKIDGQLRKKFWNLQKVWERIDNCTWRTPATPNSRTNTDSSRPSPHVEFICLLVSYFTPEVFGWTFELSGVFVTWQDRLVVLVKVVVPTSGQPCLALPFAKF